MSAKVHDRLKQLGIDLEKTTHKERVRLDDYIEEKTDKWCDDGVDDVTDEELLELAKKSFKKEALPKGKKKKKIPNYC